MHGLPLFVVGLAASTVCATLLAQALPPVYFNHATIFLSPTAYDALVQSAFLRNEFSGFREQTVQRDGGTWSYTGIFIYGQHTYLELFKAGPDSHFGTTAPEQVVFNMWIDDRSKLPLFRDRLAAQTGATLLIDTARNGQDRQMYDSVISKGGPASDFGPGMLVDTHIKGYYPDGITREKRLEGRFVPERHLYDITGFTLTADEAERERLIRHFRAYSYEISSDAEKQVATGPEITFVLVPAKPDAPRTLAIDLSTKDTGAAEQIYKFDDAGELRIRGGIARWVFTFSSH